LDEYASMLDLSILPQRTA